MHNFDKFKYIFIIFGMNHPDSSFLPRDARSASAVLLSYVIRPSVRP